MQVHSLLLSLVVLVVYMSAWFLLARWRKQLNVVDVAWGTGFAIVAWLVALTHNSARSLLIAILVSIWAVRITNHLARRVFAGGEDPRYQDMAKKWKGNFWLNAYLKVFLLQGLLVLVITLPITFAIGEQNGDLAPLSALGAVLWTIGFSIEATADRQLRMFIVDRANKGKVMDQGLWRYSRHPNYFGELTQWWAIAIIALQAHLGWIGLLGPLTLTTLILFVSGIPPIENKKKSDPEYANYMRRTSMLIPLPPKHS